MTEIENNLIARVRKAEADREMLFAALITAESDLTDCLEYFEDCYDADYQGEETGYVPNEEMRLGVQIVEGMKKTSAAIAKARGGS